MQCTHAPNAAVARLAGDENFLLVPTLEDRHIRIIMHEVHGLPVCERGTPW